jgi:hypothetical protein
LPNFVRPSPYTITSVEAITARYLPNREDEHEGRTDIVWVGLPNENPWPLSTTLDNWTCTSAAIHIEARKCRPTLGIWLVAEDPLAACPENRTRKRATREFIPNAKDNSNANIARVSLCLPAASTRRRGNRPKEGVPNIH